jgi:hypothetical protein
VLSNGDPIGRVDGRGGAHRLGQATSAGRKVSRNNGFHASVAKPGDDRNADRPAPKHQRGLIALDRRLVHRVKADGHRLGQGGVPCVQAVGDGCQQRRRQQHPLGITANRIVGVDNRFDAGRGHEHR